MGEIKSAIEIALERTKDIQADKTSLESEEYRKRGKKIISAYLNDPDNTLDGCFKDIDKDKIQLVKEGMFASLLSNLTLAQDPAAVKKVKRLEGGFLKIIEGSKKIKLIFEQLEGFYSEYIEGRKRLKEQLYAQYEPRLRKKAEALSKQLGAPVRLDPESDPEFMQLLRQNYASFDDRFYSVIAKLKEEIKTLYEQANK